MYLVDAILGLTGLKVPDRYSNYYYKRVEYDAKLLHIVKMTYSR